MSTALESDFLGRLSQALRNHLTIQGGSESRLARAIGVTHPTLSRMLHTDRPGSDGVAVRHWVRAMQLTGHLEPFVTGIEQGARSRAGDEFVPLDEESVMLTGSATMPPTDEDEARADMAMLRIGHAIRSVIPTSPTKSIRRLAAHMGVTQPTLTNLLNPIGDHAGGTAVRYLVAATSALGLEDALVSALPEPVRKAPAIKQAPNRAPQQGHALTL